MKRHFTEPLEIKAGTRRRWKGADHGCIVEISEEKDHLRSDLKTDIDICMSRILKVLVTMAGSVHVKGITGVKICAK